GALPHPGGGRPVEKGAPTGHLVAVDGNNDIARLQPGLACGADALPPRAEGARHPPDPHGFAHLARHRVEFGTEPRPLQLAAGNGAVHHQPDHVGGNGKTNAVRAAGTGEDGRVDADHAGRHVNQCAAGVAGVDRSIGLDEDLRVRVTDLRAAERRDYAARHGLADAERVADGQHHVAHFDGIGVLKFQVGEVALPALDAQHSDVRLVVELYDPGIELTTVGQCDADFRRPTDLDDVRVGDHHPFGG